MAQRAAGNRGPFLMPTRARALPYNRPMDSKLKQAGYWRRTFAFLIDALFLTLCTVIVYANLTSTYLVSAMGGEKVNEEMLQYAYDTGLYNMEEKNIKKK